MQRAIKYLSRLSDPDLFEETSLGIANVNEHVTRLDAAAHTLSDGGHHHAARIIGGLAEEEAAKILILLDAIRCPESSPNDRSRTLGYFYDHVAKGIYAEVCNWRPVNFAEVMDQIERLREENYLDGPSDVDWIFPNQITQRREDDLYVGYVCDDSDESGQGNRHWTRIHNEAWLGHRTTAVIKVTRALHHVGMPSPDCLAALARLWRQVDVNQDMRWDELRRLNRETLEQLDRCGMLVDSAGEDIGIIIEKWPFPLWPLDLRIKKVNKERLREIRRNWSPDW